MIIKNLVKARHLNFVRTSCFSMQFDGFNELFSAPFDPIFELERTDKFSFSIVFKIISFKPLFNPLIAKFSNDPPGRGYFLGTQNQRLRMALFNSGGTNGLNVTGTTILVTNKWYHAAGTYDATSTAAGTNIYLDAVAETKTGVIDTLTATISNPARPLTIGGYTVPARYSNVLVQSVKLWKEELTPADVLSDFQGVTPKAGDLLLYTSLGNQSDFITPSWNARNLTGLTGDLISANMNLTNKKRECGIKEQI